MHPEGKFCPVYVKDLSASKGKDLGPHQEALPLDLTGLQKAPRPRLLGFKQIGSPTHEYLIQGAGVRRVSDS